MQEPEIKMCACSSVALESRLSGLHFRSIVARSLRLSPELEVVHSGICASPVAQEGECAIAKVDCRCKIAAIGDVSVPATLTASLRREITVLSGSWQRVALAEDPSTSAFGQIIARCNQRSEF